MVWMTTFCFCCTVRLGLIFSAVVSIAIKIGEILCLVLDPEIVPKIRDFLETDPELNENLMLKVFNDFLRSYPEEFILINYAESGIYLASCVLCIYGTLKIQRWFLVPYIINQFIFVIVFLTAHVTTMLLIKNEVNLGLLIGWTIGGGFVFLFLGYQWCGAVGMFQIIKLVNSPKYKATYGDDPFFPVDLVPVETDSVENIKVFTTPNYQDVYNTKTMNAFVAAKEKYTYGMVGLGNDMESGLNREISAISYARNNSDNYWYANELIGFRKGVNYALSRTLNRNNIGYF